MPSGRELARIAGAAGVLVGSNMLAYKMGYGRGWHDAKDPRQEWEMEVASKEALKGELLDHLAKRSYVKLAASSTAGVGVFAVVDIPAGADPFCMPNAHLRAPERPVELQFIELLRHCPPSVVDHVLDFHDAADASGTGEEPASKYFVNATGMASMDASWYLNHSESANVVAAPQADGFTTYRTSRAIVQGEELLLDYRVGLPSVYAKMQLSSQAQAEDSASGE